MTEEAKLERPIHFMWFALPLDNESGSVQLNFYFEEKNAAKAIKRMTDHLRSLSSQVDSFHMSGTPKNPEAKMPFHEWSDNDNLDNMITMFDDLLKQTIKGSIERPWLMGGGTTPFDLTYTKFEEVTPPEVVEPEAPFVDRMPTESEQTA